MCAGQDRRGRTGATDCARLRVRGGLRDRLRALTTHTLWLLTVLCMISLAVANVSADSRDERRVRAGARLFRSLLAAEIGVERKIGADGRLHVLVLGGDAATNNEVVALIVPPGGGNGALIRGLAVQVDARAALPKNVGDTAAVFLGGVPSPAELERVLQWAAREKVLVFSPFEGHVERGVHAGLSIEAKVQPYVNEAALARSGIVLKPFFLRVAKVYR